MRFIPHNDTVLTRKVSSSSNLENNSGIFLKKSNMDLYEILEVCPKNELKDFRFDVGDIVMACSTGTPLVDPDTGKEYVLLFCKEILAKVLN